MARAELIDDELREAFRVEAQVTLQAVGPELAAVAVDGRAGDGAVRSLAEAAHKIRGGALVLGLTAIAERMYEVESQLRQELASPRGVDLRPAAAVLVQVERDCGGPAAPTVEGYSSGHVADGRNRPLVLQIEDDMVNLLLVRRILERRRPDVELVTFQLARDGLAFALSEQPSLILLDLHFPDIAGSEVLIDLRADVRTRAIPVVVISGDVGDSQGGGVAPGETLFLPKPFAMEELLAVVEQACGPPVEADLE